MTRSLLETFTPNPQPRSSGILGINNHKYMRVCMTLICTVFIGFSAFGQMMPDLPITFEDPGVDYNLSAFGGLVNVSIVQDPQDTTNSVVTATKSMGAQ